MIELEKQTMTTSRLIYTATAPDTSLITATVENAVATFLAGGTEVAVPLDWLSVFAKLTAAVAEANPAPETAPEPDPNPGPQMDPNPAPAPEPDPAPAPAPA